MMIAVAGYVAERCWAQVLCPASEQITIEEDLWDQDAMSPSDWAAAGRAPGEADAKLIRCCEAVEGLLLPAGLLRSTLVRASRDLIVHGWINRAFAMQVTL